MDARGDQARFFGKLAALMSAGIPMLRAFEVGLTGVAGPGLAAALSRILDRAYSGSSLTEAFEDETSWFKAEVRTLVAVGEERGEIEKVAAAISEGLERCVFDAGEPGDDSEGSAGDVLARILEEARAAGATDIHVEPSGTGLWIRIRAGGVLRDLGELDEVVGAELIQRARRRAGLGSGPGAGPEFGEFTSGDAHVRVDLCPFVEGEGMVLRLAPGRTEAPALERAGLSPEARDEVRRWIARPNGVILVAGPRGSGRRNLLAALAGELDPTSRRILAVGASAAFRLPGVSRIRAGAGRPLSYGQALEAALDQDLDVVLLEEIPDRAAAVMAMETARSGHLVLAATGAVGAPEAVLDLLALGVEPEALADAVAGAIACRRTSAPDGCRSASFEVMRLGPDLARIVREDPSRDRLRRAAVAAGMTPFPG